MDVEAAIHGAVSDPGNYPGATIDSMITNFRFPDPFTLKVTIENTAGFINAVMTNASPTFSIFLNDKLNDCGATFASKDCVMQVEISRGSLTAAGVPTFAYAYRIRINPSINIKVLNLGSNHDDAFSDASIRPPPVNPTTGKSDYNLYVPQFLLLANTQTDCVAGTAGLTGFDRRTGMAQCLLSPTVAEACGPTQIAKGLTTVPDAGTFKMRLQCATTRIFTCGQPIGNGTNEDYSLYKFDPASLDPDYYAPVGAPVLPATVNKCVFSSATSSIFGSSYISAANRGSVTFNQVCPPRYNITAGNDCTMVVTTPNGNCTYCPSGTRDAYGVCLGPPEATRFWVSAGWTPNGSSISNNAGSPGFDSITCFAPNDNTDVTIYPECVAPKVNSINRPARKAQFTYTADCTFDNSVAETIDAGAL